MIQRLEQQGRIMVESLLIETKNLTKSYGPHVALDDLNLSIPNGATGLLGPNGAEIDLSQNNARAHSSDLWRRYPRS